MNQDGLFPLQPKVDKHFKFSTFDLEFKDDELILGGFYDGNEYYSFKSVDMFLGKVLSRKYKNIYAHYGGKADFLFILEALKKTKYNYNIIDVNGRILELKVKIDKDHSIKFRDSYALMPTSLDTLMKSFDTSHKKIPIDFNNKNWKCNKHNIIRCNECLAEHCKNDTYGLYESIEYFKNIINSFDSNLKLTIASTSLSLFRSKYLKQCIPNINYNIISGYDINMKPILINPENIIRQYYFGGRSEIFNRYCEYQYYYDVNSLYPYVMSSSEFPISNPLYVLPESLNFEKDKGFAFAEIEYYKDKIIPFLPFRIKFKYSNKLIYPHGVWQGLYDLDVLRKAKSLGYKINIKYALIFNYDSIFKDFVNDLYPYRLKSDGLNIVIKFLLNSQYGKYAQKRLIKSISRMFDDNKDDVNSYVLCDENNIIIKKFKEKPDIELEKGYKIKHYLECLIPYNDELGLYKIQQEINSKHIIPSISSRVTSLAQLKLYDLIEKCNHDVSYCDTDAVITGTKLQTGKGLGELKLEYEVDKAIFLLPKTYYLKGFNIKKDKHEEIIKMKGFTNTNFNVKNFEDALYHNDYSKFQYEEKRLWGFKESLQRRQTFLTFENKPKSIKSIYDKREILNDGIHTMPLKINNHMVIK